MLSPIVIPIARHDEDGAHAMDRAAFIARRQGCVAKRANATIRARPDGTREVVVPVRRAQGRDDRDSE